MKDARWRIPCRRTRCIRSWHDLQNCRAIEIPFGEKFDLPAELATTGAALTIVCNPNAPTGSLVPVEELASLADRLAGVLLIDEAYADFAEQNCASLVKDFDNVIVLRSLSKGYSLAGLRFGYAIAQKDLIDGLIKVKDSYNVDALAIALATAAIKDQAYFRQNVEKIKKEQTGPDGAVAVPRFCRPRQPLEFRLCPGARTAPAARIHEQLAQRNIFVRYWNAPGIQDKLRISVGTKEQNDEADCRSEGNPIGRWRQTMSSEGMNRRQFVGTAALAAAGLLGTTPDSGQAQQKPQAGKPGIKVGLYSITFLGVWYQGKGLTLEQMIRKAKEYGYDGVEIDGKRPHGNPNDWPTKRCKQLRSLADGEGIEIYAVAGNNDFSSPICEHREAQIVYMRELIRMASDFGARRSGSSSPGRASRSIPKSRRTPSRGTSGTTPIR